MKKMIVISLVVVAVFAAACQMTNCGKAKAESAAAKPLRVGVYDSRAIAVACGPTERLQKEMQKKMKEMAKAKAAGDTQKIKELDEWGKKQQQRLHMMGFGTTPVHEQLGQIKDQLPTIAEQAGVDMIVSKWQIDYQIKDAQFVDVTDAMVALYQPNEKAMKSIEAMKKVKPLSDEDAANIND